jgi:RNA polymerase sigma-70 factor, ECF subfamily
MTDADAVFVAERDRLVGIAYRMTGSQADAEDVVGDAYLRWRDRPREDVRNPAAYLTTVVTRLAIDRLRGQARRRAEYVGPWLAEPVLTDPGPDPADAVILAESLTLGFLMVLDRLDPVDRAVFLLRDVFGEPYDVVAAVVDRSEPACRQIARRARERVRAERATHHRVDRARCQQLFGLFVEALERGDLDALRDCLHRDVVLVSDGGPNRRAARNPVRGPVRVARFLHNLARRNAGQVQTELSVVNHEPALLVVVGGEVVWLMVLETAPEGITGVRTVVNPDKLSAVNAGRGREETGRLRSPP